jgi:hypothetical protein
MTADDFIGWIAAALTLLTFSLRSMMSLRIAAVAANVCFIAYGVTQELYPVIALHSLLIPCNLYRLLELLRDARQDAVTPQHGRHLQPEAPAEWPACEAPGRRARCAVPSPSARPVGTIDGTDSRSGPWIT